ncbi:hypothetical protein SKAU_G00191310 [Synaphobranchus kaupii]|uniref:Uncharacterized protein n=1 Tax=Synaphobranchus kaupii TaxID=118154 RepID=A0A9Q1FDQ2_SYNKA|nr:hypothetical protein SKAU_G00191310 [Synaphobranchus kaupii]
MPRRRHLRKPKAQRARTPSSQAYTGPFTWANVEACSLDDLADLLSLEAEAYPSPRRAQDKSMQDLGLYWGHTGYSDDAKEEEVWPRQWYGKAQPPDDCFMTKIIVPQKGWAPAWDTSGTRMTDRTMKRSGHSCSACGVEDPTTRVTVPMQQLHHSVPICCQMLLFRSEAQPEVQLEATAPPPCPEAQPRRPVLGCFQRMQPQCHRPPPRPEATTLLPHPEAPAESLPRCQRLLPPPPRPETQLGVTALPHRSKELVPGVCGVVRGRELGCCPLRDHDPTLNPLVTVPCWRIAPVIPSWAPVWDTSGMRKMDWKMKRLGQSTCRDATVLAD